MNNNIKNKRFDGSKQALIQLKTAHDCRLSMKIVKRLKFSQSGKKD